MAKGGSAKSEDRLAEEVRLGMALNGGVSLAVWMGGCAVELDCARRAHLAPEPAAGPAPERSVYNALCSALRRELVIDVMSGSSAGGINGALLATTIRHGRRLPAAFVRKAWIELGDLSRILQRTSTADPRSLMQGQLFHAGLRDTFERLCADPETELPEGQQGLPELDVALDVTATNLVGERRAFADAWDRELVAREHRTRFKFRSKADYRADALAAAARSSASFPFAFEPWRAEGAVTSLAGIGKARWMIDGGLLDNAPIGAALDLIPYRPATRQVRRYLCYVNADPPLDEGEGGDAPLQSPTPAKVAGHVVGLPRKAPFVDQLTAIEQATRRIAAAGDTAAIELVRMDGAALERTADALLGPYRHQRLRLSLEEILAPAAASAVYRDLVGEQLGDAPAWIPASLAPAARDGDGARWQWGLQPAERIVFLLLDVLRRATRVARPLVRLVLFEARARVEEALATIVLYRRSFLTTVADLDDGRDAATVLAEASVLMTAFDPRPALRAAADAVFAVAWLLDGDLPPEGREPAPEGDAGDAGSVARGLFGVHADRQPRDPMVRSMQSYRERRSAFFGPPPDLFLQALLSRFPLADDGFDHLLRRALAVEVVGRAVAPDEGAVKDQELRFVQLTPHSPGRIFTDDPLAKTGWATPGDKLTGIHVGHFAAFYRSSWRANDFMWGRLDTAARIVEILVSPGRAKQLREDHPDADPAHDLAWALLPEGASDDRRWLVEEALRSEPCGSLELLRELLTQALTVDLMTDDATGVLTSAICTRAAQLEILAEELPCVQQTSIEDARDGAGGAALALPLGGGELRGAIEILREQPALPKRLTAADEETSELALRTGAHAGLVGLAMLRTARVPLARALFAARAALLPIAGSASKLAPVRAVVAVAFWAAALLVAAHLVGAGGGDASLDVDPAALTQGAATLMALLVIAGVAAVPGLRAWRGDGKRLRLRRASWSAALVLTGCGAGAAIALVASLLDEHPAATGHRFPTWVAALVVAFFAGTSIGGAAAVVRGQVDRLLRKPWGGKWALGAAAALAALVGGAAGYAIVATLIDDFAWWRAAIAAIALVAAPLAAVWALRLRVAAASPRLRLRRST